MLSHSIEMAKHGGNISVRIQIETSTKMYTPFLIGLNLRHGQERTSLDPLQNLKLSDVYRSAWIGIFCKRMDQDFVVKGVVWALTESPSHKR